MPSRRWLIALVALAALLAGAGLRLLAGRLPGAAMTVYSPDQEGRRQTPAEVAPGPGQALVYYPDHGIPVPVVRTLPATQGLDGMRAALVSFLTDPAPAGLAGPPAGITVENLAVKGDVARIRLRLSPELARVLASGGWNFSPFYTSVIYTLTEFPGIHRVQFDFSGLSAAALQQCRTPLSVPLGRPGPERGRG